MVIISLFSVAFQSAVDLKKVSIPRILLIKGSKSGIVELDALLTPLSPDSVIRVSLPGGYTTGLTTGSWE